MAEESKAPTTEERPSAPLRSEAPEKIHRGRIGTNVAVQVLLSVTLFGIVNYLGWRHFKQWDKTYNREFTLSEDTLALLRQIDKKVEITVLSQKGSPEQRDLWQLAEQYHREARGKFRIELVDPLKDVEAFQRVYAEGQKARIKLDDMGVFLRVINAKSAKAPAPSARGSAGDEDEAGSGATFLRQSSLFRYGQEGNRPVMTGFIGESKITGALQAIVRGNQLKVYWAASKGGLRVSQNGTAATVFNEMAGRQNIKVVPLFLADVEKIPDDARALIFLSPQGDLSEREAQMVRQYWEGKQRAVLVLLNTNTDYTTPLLEKFLAENGIVPQTDRVLRTYGTSTGPQSEFQVQAHFVDGSPITKGIAGTETLLTGQTRSLKLTPDAEKPRTQNIDLKSLLQPADAYWGEINYLDRSPQADDQDHKPPLCVAATAERGGSRDPLIAVESSRLVVVGNSFLLDPDSLTQQNYDFINSCLNWIVQQENYIGINPTPKGSFRVELTGDQQNRVFLLTTIILPAAVLMLGMFVWGVRRS